MALLLFSAVRQTPKVRETARQQSETERDRQTQRDTNRQTWGSVQIGKGEGERLLFAGKLTIKTNTSWQGRDTKSTPKLNSIPLCQKVAVRKIPFTKATKL